MRELLPMGSLHLRSGKVLVRVGDPIPTEGMTIKDRDELTERLRSDVARMMGVDITPYGGERIRLRNNGLEQGRGQGHRFSAKRARPV